MSVEQRYSILVVDDTEANIDIMVETLGDLYDVSVAMDGAGALESVAEVRPDLILLDIMMPGMDGYEVCNRLRKDPGTKDIPIIFVTAMTNEGDEQKGLDLGAVDYITKPFRPGLIKARVRNQLELKKYRDHLELLVKDRTRKLEATRDALADAMKNLHTIKITDGVHWLQVPEVNLYILCGCPADIVKLMMKKGLISITKQGDVSFETGPNAILLSDVSIQNGVFSNLAEFPVLQMLYRQGMILPNHPNNTGLKPILIGTREQVDAQMQYIYRGNYGLNTIEEIIDTGVSQNTARELMELKKKFAFGKIRPTEELLDFRNIGNGPVEIRDGVFVERKGFNKYEFRFKKKAVQIDLNLKKHETYESPYPLGFHRIDREYFAVIHSGEGDGWDFNRPCMASIIIYLGKIYLIDAGPSILHALRALSIDISEVEGIFHTHAHDDHFAGLPALIQSDHRIKYYATPLVRSSASKKLSALLSMDESKFDQYFEVHDMDLDTWNDFNGLEVKPLYSPHPVETNIFLFRTLAEDGYKTYAHWADIISLATLKKMTAEGNLEKIYSTVKNNYLTIADIKKVDIGGAPIHGDAKDYKKDKTKQIILAHTALNLDEQQKEIGSERSFGTADVLISANQNYLRSNAAQLLGNLFPGIALEQLRALLNAPVVSFNPGSIMQKQGSKSPYIYFILTGTVEFIHSEFMIQNHLSKGSFIGNVSRFKNIPSTGTWRAITYVQALRFSADLYSAFLEKYGLYEEMKNILDKIDFLRNTSLFGEGISYLVQNNIAKKMELKTYKEHEKVAIKESLFLGLLKKGELQLMNSENEIIEVLKIGEFFGEERYFTINQDRIIVQATKPSEVFLIENYPFLEIPIVHWKFLEKFEKRKKLLSQ